MLRKIALLLLSLSSYAFSIPEKNEGTYFVCRGQKALVAYNARLNRITPISYFEEPSVCGLCRHLKFFIYDNEIEDLIPYKQTRDGALFFIEQEELLESTTKIIGHEFARTDEVLQPAQTLDHLKIFSKDKNFSNEPNQEYKQGTHYPCKKFLTIFTVALGVGLYFIQKAS